MRELRIIVKYDHTAIDLVITEELFKSAKDHPEYLGMEIIKMIEKIGFPPKIYGGRERHDCCCCNSE